jgi:hypothetical protein
MLHKLLILFCLTCATVAKAQEKQPPTNKNTQKLFDTEIDYKQPGAPMPPLTILVYRDTAKKTVTTESKAVTKTKGKKVKQKTVTTATPSNTAEHLLMTEKDFDNGANLLIMMFNPTCSHCEDMTAMLEKNIHLFKRSKIVLLATMPMKDYLADFVNMLHINEYPTMHVGCDSSGFINNVFLYRPLPQINIYSGERKLLRTFSGEVPMDSLKRYIQ